MRLSPVLVRVCVCVCVCVCVMHVVACVCCMCDLICTAFTTFEMASSASSFCIPMSPRVTGIQQ